MHHPSSLQPLRHIHLVGIGGTGMCGIAEVLHNLGYVVSGSDQVQSVVTRRLQNLGVAVRQGHDASYLQNVDVVVVSSAVRDDNPEIVWAHAHNIPVIPRAQMLAELMRFRYGIAVSGTHGKTTTTSLIAHIFAEADLDPTFVIGGRLKRANSNARLGEGKYFIVEADESDGSFRHYQPMLSVITNINPDHLENFSHSFEELKAVFAGFIDQLPFYGLAVCCGDDPNIQALLPTLSRRVLTYGFAADNLLFATDVIQQGWTMHFTVHWQDQRYPMTLNLAGQHNVLNALAAIGVALECGMAFTDIQRALASFQGVGRRCDLLGDVHWPNGTCTVVDDYGHHPVELAATFATLRAAYPDRRLCVVFQPHRYTRTQRHFDEFVAVLSVVDQLWLLPIHPAGEAVIPGAESQDLCDALQQRGISVSLLPSLDGVEETLATSVQAHDVLLLQGAGTIGRLAEQITSWFGDE